MIKSLLTKQNLWTGMFAATLLVGTSIGAWFGETAGGFFGMTLSLLLVAIISTRLIA